MKFPRLVAPTGVESVAVPTTQTAEVRRPATITGNASGAVVEAGGVDNGTPGTPSAAGNLDVSDADAGQAMFLAVAPESLAGIYGNFTFNDLTGEWNYTLDQSQADSLGEKQPVTDALTVTSLDGTASETITVNITGVNDAPEAKNDSNSVTEDALVCTVSGNVLTDVLTGDTDVDFGDSLTVIAVNGSADLIGDPAFGKYGFLLMDANANGAYSYFLDNTDPDTNALAECETVQDEFTYTLSDVLGATSTAKITINITGADEALVTMAVTNSAVDLTVIDTPSTPADGASSNGNGNAGNNAPVAVADEANANTYGTSGNVLGNDMDLDTGDSLIVTAVNGKPVEGDLSFGSYGYLLMTDAGDWGYQLNNAGIDALAQGASVDDVFGYTIEDTSGAVASSTLTIHVDASDFIL